MNDDDPIVLECGHSIEELSVYLDNGRIPRDASIESCPECLNALEALSRVGMLSRDLLADDAVHLPPPPDSWFRGILDAVRAEVGAGRSIPISHPDPRVRITVTEGAVRSLMRSVGDSVDGLYIGRTHIIGDAEIPGAPVEIHLTASTAWNRPIPELTESLRLVVSRALAAHTDLNVTAVNVTVEDIHGHDTSKDRS